MNKKSWVIFGFVFFLVSSMGLPAFGWDKIVSFGDSLSDNGTEDGYGHPDGPFSDGVVWLDYLAESMTDVTLEDRAIGGARTNGPVLEDGFDIGMTAQIDDYISELSAGSDLSGVLFTVWIGGNDFLNMEGQDPRTVMMAAISSIDRSLQALVAAGAEEILVMNLPDLGLTPLYNGAQDTAAMATGLSALFNTHLKQLMCNLNIECPGVKFYMADTFKLLQYAVKKGEELGLPNVSRSCTEDEMYPGCEGYLFFDAIHPTTATHKYLAALAVGQVKHGRVSKEMKQSLKDLNPLYPRMPFIVSCEE